MHRRLSSGGQKEKFDFTIWQIGLAVVVLLFLVLVSVQDSLARLVWQKYRNADAALLLDSGDADLAMLIGNYYFGVTAGSNAYDLGIAERAYRKAVAIDSKILWGHYQLARIHFLGSDFEKALEEINNEMFANPDNLRSLYVRGLIYGYRGSPGDLAKAERDFQRFVQWSPKEWAGYNDLAWIQLKRSKYQEARSTVLNALKEVPDADNNPWLWNSLGVAELNLRDYGATKASFERAKELAGRLTIADWQHAYPGNNPADAQEGFRSFIQAIEDNLRSAQEQAASL